mmetsp:Transcript_6250/g.15470  ORF Transcript_6250/g.15470 Transcript_6250/m.15470 type:complete len:523 (-) Transcript_6250:314-1882(-)
MSRIRDRRATKHSGGILTPTGAKKQKSIDFDDTIDSDGEHEYDEDSVEEDVDEKEEETLDSKKVRLAREYLRKIKSGGFSDGSSDDYDDSSDEMTYDDRIGIKLRRERMKYEGILELNVADKVHENLDRMRKSLSPSTMGGNRGDSNTWTTQRNEHFKGGSKTDKIRLLRGHDLTPTCVALQYDGIRAISGSKDHSIIVWDIQEERRAMTLCPSWRNESAGERETTSRTLGEVLSVACSDDGRYAAVGRRDATICIYDIRANTKTNLVKTFSGHKGPVTSLCFRTQSLELFSGSEDRCIRHYNLSEMMYLETLYGHQFGVTDVDCYLKDRPISVGRDRTGRMWKIAEDTHLIFRGGAKIASADSVRIMRENWFLTGHEDGNLGLWMAEKKRAVVNIQQAHGAVNNIGCSISAIGSLRGSDLAVTGSCDGYIRLWKVVMGETLKTRSLESLDKIPLNGYVNGIAIGPKARFCVAAVGQEPKLGRWNRISGAKNRIAILQLRAEEGIASEKSAEDLQASEVKAH